MSAIWVAQEEGLFKKHGLDLELIHIASTSRAIQSMLSGEIHYTTADALNSIQAVGAGAGFNPLALTYLNRLSDHLFVSARYVAHAHGGEVLWRPGATRG